MRIRSRLLAGVGVALIAAGCDNFTAPRAEPVAEAPADARTAEAELQRVSRAIATALGGRNIRLMVRDAMRDSPWDVHQISLRDYLESPAGRTLLEAAGRAAGETPEAFADRVRALPDLDFYVPDREQRKTWNGAGEVVVAASLVPEGGTVLGFGPDGERVAQPLGAGSAGRIVMLLHPAEPRGVRNRPQPAGMGDVIQTTRDGEDAVRLRWISAEGKVTEIPFRGASSPRSGEGARYITMSNGSTYLRWLQISFLDPGDDAEISVYAKFYAPNGGYLGAYQYDNYSTPFGFGFDPEAFLAGHVIPDSSAAYVEVKVREDDNDTFGSDDWFGPRSYTWSDRGEIRSIINGNDVVNLELDWNRLASPVYTSLVIRQNVEVVQGGFDFISASRVDQYGYTIPGSFTVSSWSTGDASIASVTSSQGSSASVRGNSPGGTSITASYGGKTASGWITVSESAEEPGSGCPPPELFCE